MAEDRTPLWAEHDSSASGSSWPLLWRHEAPIAATPTDGVSEESASAGGAFTWNASGDGIPVGSASAAMAGPGVDPGAGPAGGAVRSTSSSGTHLLEARSIMKRFGGLQALHEVSLYVDPGEVLGLVGPNGAGKTTLFNCICGQLRPDGGSVWFDGRRVDDLPPYKRARLGIARTFQRVEVFSEMTVREHLLVAERARRGVGALWKDLLNMGGPTREELDKAQQLIAAVGLESVADTPVAALSLGHCRLVELARALALEPRLLLADEPSSGLDTRETAVLAALLRRVQRERGTAILLVEHDLDMVAQVVDRCVVLDFGHEIASGPLDEVIADPAVRRAYLGKTA